MTFTERWIWLHKDKYPNSQTTGFSCGGDPVKYNYTVAEFKKTYTYDKKIKKVNEKIDIINNLYNEINSFKPNIKSPVL